jgi:hypothetical protein
MSPTKQSTNRVVTGVAAVAAAGLLALGGAAIANAASNPTPTPSTTSPSTESTPSAPGTQGYGHGCGGPGGSNDTTVTGAEATKVADAVKAKYSGVTVSTVRKDADGSYDVLGTRSGSPVFYDVSKDLSTVTERTGMGMGHRGQGSHQGGTNQSGTGTEGTQNSSLVTS